MEFSEVFEHSGQLRVSDCASYIAHSQGTRLCVRYADTLETVAAFNAKDRIDYIEFSSDSELVLCACFGRVLVEVFAVNEPSWNCSIDQGTMGLSAVRWTPDGRHIMATADMNILATIWSLVSRRVHYVEFPKHAGKGCSFSRDGKYMAVLERIDCNDHVTIFSCEDWTAVKSFRCQTQDAADLEWSPDGHFLAVWESPLSYNVVIYNLKGDLLGSFSAYKDALGIKGVQWSSTGQILAVGSYDESVRLLNNITWGKVTELKHPHTITPGPKRVLYVESEGNESGTTKFTVSQDPLNPHELKLSSNKPNPRIGVAWMRFSPDGTLLATRNDIIPSVLWIWSMAKLRLLAVLQCSTSLRDAAWHPDRNTIAFVSGKTSVFFWSERGASAVQIPCEVPFSSSGLTWTQDGSGLIITDKDRFCVATVPSSV